MQATSTEIKRPSVRVGNGLQLQPDTNLKRDIEEGQKNRRISLLINSVYFFIESVFILETENGFRLIAIHQNKVLTDETYKTVKGAKIAFLKLFAYKAWEEGVKPQWTSFYPPEEKSGPLHNFEEIVNQGNIV